ncbi:hypothetical protein AMS68_006468 [Peltaster fructicola]|uniref:CoA-binding domain-containing protein n=1 Tax=Peltaster fructicola TaxID=286661 RepID=A0A6H0Y1Z5_9PEZI|nr:hypothetical protein AMS68_006468 [Peltaster fructicola]
MSANDSTTSMSAAARTFFSASTFAVAGASSNPAKFGHKIFAWYLAHDLTVVPLNPGSSTISVQSKAYDTVSSPQGLSHPKNTSLSIITPPAITAGLLKEAKEVGIKAVWLQPGSFGDSELAYALKEFPGAAVGGFAPGTRGGEGWCVLVDGDAAIKAAGQEQKL